MTVEGLREFIVLQVGKDTCVGPFQFGIIEKWFFSSVMNSRPNHLPWPITTDRTSIQ